MLAGPVYFMRSSARMAALLDRFRVFVFGNLAGGKMKNKIGVSMAVSWLRQGGLELAHLSHITIFLQDIEIVARAPKFHIAHRKPNHTRNIHNFLWLVSIEPNPLRLHRLTLDSISMLHNHKTPAAIPRMNQIAVRCRWMFRMQLIIIARQECRIEQLLGKARRIGTPHITP